MRLSDIEAYLLLWVLAYCSSVLSEQEFHRNPEDTSVRQGKTVTLKCIVKNRVNGEVQWTRGEFGLGTDKTLPNWPRYTIVGNNYTNGNDHIEEFSLKIINVKLEDDAEFQCQIMASEEAPGIQSRKARLQVLIPPNPPIIENGDRTLNVTLNEAKNITCRALDGKPKSQITWFKNGIRLADKTYELATTKADGKRVDTIGIATIIAKSEDAGKKIECRAWNEALEGVEPYQTQAILNVKFRPVVQMSVDTDNTIKEYQSIKFTCTGRANPQAIKWKWFRNNRELGETRDTLLIPRITRDYNAETIRCRAENDVGWSEGKKHLTVNYGPEFIGRPVHKSASIGDRVNLNCSADGNPPASIVWRRKESFRPLGSETLLSIPKIDRDDFGVYICTATVFGFDEITREIYLTENGPPEIMSEKVQYAAVGDTAKIQCMAISSPKPTDTYWSFNGQNIDYPSSGRFSAPLSDLPYGQTSVLQILDVEEGDFGEYNCTVVNTYGTATLMITLEEKTELPIPVIIGGAVGGLAVIFIIVIACVVYHRCRHSDNESYAETDSNTEIKKRDKNESPSEFTKSTLMDQWRQDYNYRYSADYDEQDSKANNMYGSFITDPYTSQELQNGHIFPEYTHRTDETVPVDRYETYNTGYIPSTFRSPSRTDFSLSRSDVTPSRTDFTTRSETPYRLPPADLTTAKLATNV